MMSTRISAYAAVLGLVAVMALPSEAEAQARVKPEVMILLDTSASMSFPDDQRKPLNANDADNPWCSPPDANAPSRDVSYGRSRMMVAQDVLTGASPMPHWCIYHDPQFREQHHELGGDHQWVHTRAMCCAEGLDPELGTCDAWAPCGNDHGQVFDRDDKAEAAHYGEEQGLIPEHLHTIKFGLMTFDSHPNNAAGVNGHFSYGRTLDVPNNIANDVGRGAMAGFSAAIARGERQPNLGARGPRKRHAGGLVRSYRGIDQDGAVEWNEPVGEEQEEVASHNRLVMDRVRRVVPIGGTPLAPLLDDALHYYDRADDQDPKAACRKRVAVLITDGSPSRYYGGQLCANNAACGERGLCVKAPCTADVQCEDGACQGGRCVADDKVCEYSEGYPYESSTVLAARLYDQGIPLFVVGLEADDAAKTKMKEIALAGAPNLGPEADQPGLYFVKDRAELSEALARVTSRVSAAVTTRNRPLVLQPTTADDYGDEDIRQLRLFSYSERPAGDQASYGRVISNNLGCDDDARDPEGDGNGRLELTSAIGYHDELQRLQVRRTVARDRGDGDGVLLLGGNGAIFNQNGSVDAGNEDDARRLSKASRPEDLADDRLPNAGLLVNGFFGDRGLPEDGQLGKRQLGKILEGDMIAIQAPGLEVSSPSFRRYFNAQRNRPSMVAAGAGDGQVHFFRAVDGEEMFTFAPRRPLEEMQNDEPGTADADGPLAFGHVAQCRALTQARDGCPSEPADLSFRSLVVGGTGAHRNFFGIDVTNTADLVAGEDNQFAVNALFQKVAGNEFMWNTTGSNLAGSTQVIPKLGQAVSRPALTHVRVGDEVRGAVVVGCGSDPRGDNFSANQELPGRCVAVLEATTGKLIKLIEDPKMDLPIVGSPAVYPAGGIAPVERIYVGDAGGRLWRIDVSEKDSDAWEASIAWPPADAEEADDFALGRFAVDRPAISLKENGDLVIIYGTGQETADPANAPKAYVVSFTDTVTIDDDENVYEAKRNWVLPLRTGEFLSGPVEIRGGIAFFTTIHPNQDDQSCVGSTGRLWGVHYFRRYVTPDGEEDTFTAYGENLEVKPAIPIVDDDGTPGNPALSIVFPPGRVAYGLTIVTTPACREGQGASTDVVLNLADESGGGGPINKDEMKVESVENGQLRSAPFANLFAESDSTGLSICVGCTKDGKPSAGSAMQRPFPAVVTYWGSTFSH